MSLGEAIQAKRGSISYRGRGTGTVFKNLSTHGGCLLIMTRPSIGCLLALITLSVSLCFSGVGISVTVASNDTLVVQVTDIIVSFSHLILAAGSVFISQSIVHMYSYA